MTALLARFMNAIHSEEGAIDNSLLITILVVLGIACLGLWLFFNVNVNEK